MANVLSCTALFVALGGAAYAATTLDKKSVKTKHLAKGAVTTQKLRNAAVIRNGAVIGGKIATAAVGSTQLADGGVRSIDLGGGVVTRGKLKDGGVSTEKLANGAATNSKLGADAVTTGKLQDGAVTAAKLASTLNAQLVKNVSYVTKASSIIPISSETLTASCPANKQAIGGGARVLGASTKVALSESAPAFDGAGKAIGWTATAQEFAEEAADWTLEVHAICAEF